MKTLKRLTALGVFVPEPSIKGTMTVDEPAVPWLMNNRCLLVLLDSPVGWAWGQRGTSLAVKTNTGQIAGGNMQLISGALFCVHLFYFAGLFGRGRRRCESFQRQVPLRPQNRFLSAVFKENKVSCHHKRLKICRAQPFIKSDWVTTANCNPLFRVRCERKVALKAAVLDDCASQDVSVTSTLRRIGLKWKCKLHSVFGIVTVS